MALPSTSVWEVRPTNGADTNGGGFDSTGTGTDFSVQNAKNTVGSNISTTDAVGAASTTITSVTAAFTTAITGNIIYLQGGSGSLAASWYRATFVSSTSITVDRTVAAGTGITMNIGGALKTLTQLNTNMANFHQGWVKAESTISISTGLTFNYGSSSTQSTHISGYTTTRGDNGQVTIQTSVAVTAVTLSNNGNLQIFAFRNFIIDCNNVTSSVGLVMQTNGCVIVNIVVKNQKGGIAININGNGSAGGTAINCAVTACDNVIGFKTSANNLGAQLVYCTVTSCTSVGGTNQPFLVDDGTFYRCIAANNSGTAADGFGVGAAARPSILINCISYNNGRDGFNLSSSASYPILILNCISVSNTAWGFINNQGVVFNIDSLVNFCAHYNNGSGEFSGIPAGAGCVLLTGDPFVNGASNNFALNLTSGAGAACRAAGFPGTLNVGGIGFEDIGALQHQDPSASSVYVINRNQTILVGEI